MVRACACAVHSRVAVVPGAPCFFFALTNGGEIAGLAASLGVGGPGNNTTGASSCCLGGGRFSWAAFCWALRLTIHPLVFYGYVEHVREALVALSVRNVGRRLLLATVRRGNIALRYRGSR